MSLFGALAPLYLLGLAAISLPLIFHLIRRTPSGEIPFSSLMFLQPSPPRITRRSRLDNILLLLLRGLAICLLAFAFTRPLFRQGMSLDLSGVRNRQVAILVDVSASMRRDETWPKALDEVDSILESLDEGDQVALFAYDEQMTPIVDFDDSLPALEDQLRRIRSELSDLEPGWGKTNLPQALIRVADHVIATSLQKQTESRPLGQIYLVADLQPGSDLSELQGYEWPDQMLLDVRNVKPKKEGNAGVRLLYGETAGLNSSEQTPRVRITNSIESDVEQFRVHWVNSEGRMDNGASYLVPPGETRVIKVSENPLFGRSGSNEAVAIRLVGDKVDFDNEFFVAKPRQETIRVGYLGPDSPEDRETLPYFLSRALIDSPRRAFQFDKWDENQPLPAGSGNSAESPDEALRWLVVAQPVSETVRESIGRFAEEGGRVLVVVTTTDMQEDLTHYLGTSTEIKESSDAFVLMSTIDFKHPLFQPFADPRFSNFTGIHFWKHRIVSVDSDAELQTPAKFDDGSPMMLQRDLDDGQITVLTASWLPSESQLALSTKFLPLVAGLAGDQSRQNQPLYFEVGEPVPLPSFLFGNEFEIEHPDGTSSVVEADQSIFRDTSIPGRYNVQAAGIEYTFAVNMAASESATAPVEKERFEQFGIKLGDQPEKREQVAWERDMKDRELENRQKLWSWLIVAAVLMLIAEMFVAGRVQRGATATPESGSL